MHRAGVGVLLGVVVALSGASSVQAFHDPEHECFNSTVTIYGTPASEVITGTPEDDVIKAGAGDDVIDGAGGNDTVIGNGNTRLNYQIAAASVSVDLETSAIGTTNAVTVVGIATGNGTAIDANVAGGVVQETPIDAIPGYVGARRLL